MSLPTTSPNLSRRRWWWDTGLTVAAMVAVVWFFTWTVRSNGGFTAANDDDYYTLLVRGYRNGHLYLDRTPAPEMLALADPYDPAQNGPYRLPDATYFHGHYYLYFGATPAVILMLPYALLTGKEMPTGVAVLVFCVAGFLIASAVWLAIRRRYFPGTAAWTSGAGVVMLGLATHVLALLARPMHWELPIACGYAFSMAALAAVLVALEAGTTRVATLACGVAGLCVGLAASARPPCALGALMLVPPLLSAWRRRASGGAWWWRGALAAAAGLGLCVAAMLAHNQARFGQALEFGQNYQLTASRELSNRHFGLDYVVHNLSVYFFQPVRWTWEFPFVSAQTVHAANPNHAGSEEMSGLAVTLPFLWLALAVPLAVRGRPDGERCTLRAMLGAIGGLLVGVESFMALFFSTTERYVADFAPALGLLAAVGLLALERWIVGMRGRVFWVSLSAVLVLPTAAMGVLMSFDYHGRALRGANPLWWERAEQRSAGALAHAGLWLGQFEGPRVLKVRFRAQPAGTRETFWAPGDARADERIVIEHLREREIRFGYARGAALRWGRPLTWESGHTHTVELQLPSLYRAPGGWMRGLRQQHEFRERSCVVVWFSGERALGEIVEPLAPGLAAGGAIGSDFVGEVRGVGRRPFRADELSMTEGPASNARGGTLRLRAMLARPLAVEGEPLLATGGLYGSDTVFVREAGEGEVTFHFEHFGRTSLVSAPVNLARNHEHVIEITLPSCATGEAFGRAAEGEVVIRVDGDEVLRGRSECHPFVTTDVWAGRNPFGLVCAHTFRGWLVGAEWTGK